jgi:hypothetical protein
LAEYDFKRQNYKYITWKKEKYKWIPLSILSCIAVIVGILMILNRPYNPKP